MNSRWNVLWILAVLIGCAGGSTVVPEQPRAGEVNSGTAGGVDSKTDRGVDGGTLPMAVRTLGPPDGGTCVNTVVQVPYEYPDDCRSHICFDYDTCAQTTPVYIHNPPIGGPHYWVWANWGIHAEVVPRGYWVHNLEHGGVVFLYRPDAQQSLIDALIRVHDAIPPEQDCVDQGFPNRRVVVTQDPLLDVPWAVTVSGPEEFYCVGFGYYIKGDCIESEQALVDFAVQHRNMSAETICDEGFYPP